MNTWAPLRRQAPSASMSNASDEDEATPYSPSGLYKIAQITTLLKPYEEDNQEEDEYEDPELENLELEREALEAEARALDAQSDEHNAGREPMQKNIVFTEQILDLHWCCVVYCGEHTLIIGSQRQDIETYRARPQAREYEPQAKRKASTTCQGIENGPKSAEKTTYDADKESEWATDKVRMEGKKSDAVTTHAEEKSHWDTEKEKLTLQLAAKSRDFELREHEHAIQSLVATYEKYDALI
ncbi:hypothetical protein CFE70_005997 [Pyrenophora teres f. teres 0-1]